MTRQVALMAAVLAALAPSAYAQDSRVVTEPHVPAVCSSVAARLERSGATIAPKDETRSDTARIQQAIDQCPTGRAVELRPDGGATAFLSGPLILRQGVTLLISKGATLFASRNPRDYDVAPGSCGVVDDSGHGCKPLIHVTQTGAAVMGPGTIDGRGGERLLGGAESWWDLAQDAKPSNRHQNCPRLIVAEHADDFTLYRIVLKNSPNFHVVFSGGRGFTAWGVLIDTPAKARNTDGIDPISARDVTITHCFIHAGDDQVAIKAGNGGPSADITVAHNHFYTGHGMSIGSETNGGVRRVRVTDLSIDGADNGLRIKSNSTRGGRVDDVVYEDVCIRATKNPIVLETTYSSPDSAAPTDRIPVYRHIVFREVRIAGPGPIRLEGLDAQHALGVSFERLGILGNVPLQTSNVDLSGAPSMLETLDSCSAKFVALPPTANGS